MLSEKINSRLAASRSRSGSKVTTPAALSAIPKILNLAEPKP